MSYREDALIRKEDFGKPRKFIITLDGELIIGPPNSEGEYYHINLLPKKDNICLGGGFCAFLEKEGRIICSAWGSSTDFGRPDIDEISKVSILGPWEFRYGGVVLKISEDGVIG